ncbi:unnamed protein product [Vicia faba]|uniref:Uncharacterized protein n=1 Tax=Vicia faba TaxID=3906 RepID=A0AAV1AHN2_VICFA|nr:unnamed protein product [Vicia faba]
MEVQIGYEWKPEKFNHCQGVGHKTEECRKNKPSRQQWVTGKVEITKPGQPVRDTEGFQIVMKGVKHKEIVETKQKEALTSNPFNALEGMEDGESSKAHEDLDNRGGEGVTPLPNA